MTKYYRFIYTDEYNALLDKGFVENKTARPLFLLSENPKTKILPEKYNYNLSMEEFFTLEFPSHPAFTKEVFLSYLIGPISHDYLIELEFENTPSMYNLGWYGYDDDSELCVLETCIKRYEISNITAIYTGDFYDWRNIKNIKNER